MFSKTEFFVFFYIILGWFIICAIYIGFPAIRELYRIFRNKDSEFEDESND